MVKDGSVDQLKWRNNRVHESGNRVDWAAPFRNVADMELELSKDETAQLLGSLRRFFREELETEISELQAKLVWRFFLKEVAPLAYNKGVAEAEAFMRSRVEDLNTSCYEQPFIYWTKNGKC